MPLASWMVTMLAARCHGPAAGLAHMTVQLAATPINRTITKPNNLWHWLGRPHPQHHPTSFPHTSTASPCTALLARRNPSFPSDAPFRFPSPTLPTTSPDNPALPQPPLPHAYGAYGMVKGCGKVCNGAVGVPCCGGGQPCWPFLY